MALQTKAVKDKKSPFRNLKGLNCIYFLDASTETFLNSFKSFSSSKVDLRALGPAALIPFSISDSVLNASNIVFSKIEGKRF
jgi:hypothetical protein